MTTFFKIESPKMTNNERRTLVTHSFIGILFKTAEHTGDFCKGPSKTESNYGIKRVNSFQGFSKSGCGSKFSS